MGDNARRRRLAYAVRVGSGTARDARDAFARARWRRGTTVGVDDDVRVVAIGGTACEEGEEEGTYAWRGDVKSAAVVDALRQAVARETRSALASATTSSARVVVMATDPECVRGTTLTRALQLFFAFTRAFRDGDVVDVEVGFVFTTRAPAPTFDKGLSNVAFNLVYARVPSRRVWPTRVERRHLMLCEDREGDEDRNASEDATMRRASETWCAEHARALRAAGCDVFIDDDDGMCSAVYVPANDVSDYVTTSLSPSSAYKIAFPVKDQMAAASASVYAHVAAATKTKKTTTTTGSSALTLRDGTKVDIVQSSPERWTQGGYAAEHYVSANPQPHGAYFELRDVDTGANVGYIACSVLQRAENDVDGRFPFSSVDSVFTSANVDRLCVLTTHRRRGVKEILLRAVGDAYHAMSLPLRIKTAKESVVASFNACPLLAFERMKDPTPNGVAKRRGEKPVVVVVPSASRWRTNDNDERDYTQWSRRARSDNKAPSKPISRGVHAFATFTAALNKVTPDAVDRAANDMRSALAAQDDIRPACARSLVRAALAQPTYATCYAQCTAALDARFQAAVIELITINDDVRDDDVPFTAALRAVGLLSSSRIVDMAFNNVHVHGDDNFKALERAFRMLTVCGKSFYDDVKHIERVRAVIDATSVSSRERMRADGAPARLLFIAEDVADAIASDFEPSRTLRNADGSRRTFGAAPNASSLLDAHRAVEREFRNVSVRVIDDDDNGVGAARRGERKGWVFWYVGSPIACAHSSSQYAFAGAGARERFVRLEI